MLGVSQSRGLKLFGREIIFEEFQPMCCWYLNVTDRQTDRQTDRRLTVALPHSALASRGNKHCSNLLYSQPTDKMAVEWPIDIIICVDKFCHW